MIFSKCTREATRLCDGANPKVALSVSATKELTFYRMYTEFEARLGSITGKDGGRLGFVYRDHTIAFPQADTLATTAQLAAIRSKAFKDRNRPIAAGRHWIHHQTKNAPEFVRIATYCGTHLRALGDEGDVAVDCGICVLGSVVERRGRHTADHGDDRAER